MAPTPYVALLTRDALILTGEKTVRVKLADVESVHPLNARVVRLNVNGSHVDVEPAEGSTLGGQLAAAHVATLTRRSTENFGPVVRDLQTALGPAVKTSDPLDTQDVATFCARYQVEVARTRDLDPKKASNFAGVCVELRCKEIERCDDDRRLLEGLEDDLVDVSFKEAVWRAPRLVSILLGWSDGLADHVGLVRRATAGLRFVAGALPSYAALRLPDWSLPRLVGMLSTERASFHTPYRWDASFFLDDETPAPKEGRQCTEIFARDLLLKDDDDTSSTTSSASSLYLAAAAAQQRRRRAKFAPPPSPPPSPRSLQPPNPLVATAAAFFARQPRSTAAFADLPRREDGGDASAFAALLDAQIWLLVQLDDLSAARCRDPDPYDIRPHHVAWLVAESDTGRAARVLRLLFDRLVALILKLQSPSYADGDEKALASTGRFLVSLLQSSAKVREIASVECRDHIMHFLQFEHVYASLPATRVARCGGRWARHATTLAMHAQNAAPARPRRRTA